MSNSLAKLLKQTSIDDHNEVLQAAESSLKSSKNDINTLHVKAVALLNLDRYEDAVSTFEAGGDALKEIARLEYAYALYKAGKPSEAAEIAREGSGRGYHHVEAQARYRTEAFERAAELYEQLSASLEEDAEADLRINSGAVDAHLQWSGLEEHVRKKKPGREDLEAFETAYNAACGCVARGELQQAEVLLRRAKDLCLAVEDLSEEEKRAEAAPILVQMVYVLARLGKVEEAEGLAKEVEVKDVSDASTRHIARVNGVVATSDQNPFMVQRLVAKDLETLKPDYPFQYQSAILRRNRYATDLQAMKFGGTASSTAAAIAKQPSPTTDEVTNSLAVANVAAHARNQTGKEALKMILPVLEKRPNDVGLILTIVQLHVLTGNSDSAIKLLEGFLNRLEQSGSAAELDVRFAPGLIGTIVSLYHSQNRRSHEQRELSKAATHWRRKNKNDHPAGVTHLLRAAGASLAASSRAEDHHLATEIFTELLQHNANDRLATAGLIAASPSTATWSQISSLTPFEKLLSNTNAEDLENAGLAQPPVPPGVTTSRKRPAEDTSKPKKPHKIRKSRIPKDYDPAKTPDPERWLPLRDRSTYRPAKGKKGKQRANLLSQGAAPVGGEGSDGSRPATPGGEVVKGKAPQGGGGGGGKKKKGKR